MLALDHGGTDKITRQLSDRLYAKGNNTELDGKYCRDREGILDEQFPA